MVGLWWAVSRIARSNYADFSLRQQLSLTDWSRFAPLTARSYVVPQVVVAAAQGARNKE